MKKIFGFIFCALLVAVIALPLNACNNETMGTAYGLVHNAGYIGKATVTGSGDKISAVTLEEMCFPTQVTAGEDVADADKVTVGEGSSAKSYYKTVKYDEVTMTFDAEKNSYTIGDSSLKDYFRSEENCKAYFEAAAANRIKVMIGGEEKSGIMTNSKLNKDENGYWTRQDADGNSYSRWKLNRDATVNYVKEHGTKGLSNLKQSTEPEKDKYGVDSKYWKDSDNISTGATWADMYKDTAPSDYYTYSQLILKAASNISNDMNGSK